MRFILLLSLLCIGPAILAGPSPTTQTPVSQFRLPTFTPEGHRSMLLIGSEAKIGTDEIELVDLNLTLFSGDETNTIDTIILSPAANANPEQGTVNGTATVRVIRDDLEITGQGWTYDHGAKKVSIHSHARVVFYAQLPDILK